MNLRTAFETLVLPCKAISKGSASASKSALKWIEAIVPSVKTLPIESFSSRELAMFRAGWAATKLTPQTFNKYLRHLRSILRDLHEMEILAKLPKCKELPEDDPEVRIAENDEVQRLYKHCGAASWPHLCKIPPRDYWRALIVVAVTTGLRRSDILNIKPHDVDLEKLTLKYRAAKTNKRRCIPIAKFAGEHLRPLIDKCNPGENLFYSTQSRRQFYREWHAIQDAAEISPKIDIHDLRRTCGSHIYRTAGLNAASEMLAHSSIAVTRRHYISTDTASESLRPSVNLMPDPSEGIETL